MTKQQIGAELKRLRTEAGLSLKDLADKSGESFQHISHIENGKYNLTLERLERVAAPLGVAVCLMPAPLVLGEKSMLITEGAGKACFLNPSEYHDFEPDDTYDMRSPETRLSEDSAGWDI